MKKECSEEGNNDILIDDRVIIPDEIKQMSDHELDVYIRKREKELHLKHTSLLKRGKKITSRMECVD